MRLSDEEIRMTEDTAKVDEIPDANELVDRLKEEADKFRTICQQNIKQATTTLEFWTKQHDIVVNFLASNQISHVTDNGEPWFDPNVSLEDQYNQVQEGAVRIRPEGWNYGDHVNSRDLR